MEQQILDIRRTMFDRSSVQIAKTYDQLRRLDRRCQHCHRAQLILKDLLVLSVCTGRGPMSSDSLESTLEAVFAAGCTATDFEVDEKSQLMQAFTKVLEMGKTRDIFAAKFQIVYGGDLEVDEIEHLFMIYSLGSAANPTYESKNVEKARSRYNKRPPKQKGNRSRAPQLRNHLASSSGVAHLASSSSAQDDPAHVEPYMAHKAHWTPWPQMPIPLDSAAYAYPSAVDDPAPVESLDSTDQVGDLFLRLVKDMELLNRRDRPVDRVD